MSSDSVSPLLQNLYRPDLDVLVGRWGYQPLPSELPAAYQRLTREALAAGCRFWLQDIRRRSLNDPATTQWLLTDYFPDLAHQLGGPLAVAYLASPALLAHIMASPGYQPSESFRQRPFRLGFFSGEGEAIEWLHQQR